ncbi:MAG: class I SAM-dependent methyltransferase [Anaerolineales bacterium]
MSLGQIGTHARHMQELDRYVPAEEYDVEYYERWYPTDGFLKRELDRRTRNAMDLAGIRNGMKLIDIGCGPGDLAFSCAEVGCHVTGVDYSRSAIEIAEEKLHSYPAETAANINLELMNAKSLGFPDDQFDVAFMTDVVEHLYPEELELALSEAIRVLRASGRLVIRTAPNAWLVKPIYRLAGLLMRTGSWDTELYHVNELSARSMAKYLRKLGAPFQVVMGKANENYYLAHLPEVAGPRLRTLAKAIDWVLDSRVGEAVVFRTPLKLFLGTEIWAVVDLPAGSQQPHQVSVNGAN